MVDILKSLDFVIVRGCVTGIVGESGSGKSTLGRCLVRLYTPTGGDVIFDNRDITRLDELALKPLRRNLQMIFQDPLSSLNPRQTIARIIARPLRLYGATGSDNSLAAPVLERVHLPLEYINRYPHELSGGQRQRVGIARAIALNPKFILADEITSGLDVSTQAQILILLEELVSTMSHTLVFISHDLSVVRRLCKYLIIMQAGEIVEQGDTARIFNNPQHDYTKQLIAAIPLPEIDSDWLN